MSMERVPEEFRKGSENAKKMAQVTKRFFRQHAAQVIDNSCP